MATASHVTTLIRSFKENDKERFIATAIQLAAHEAKLGHNAVAYEIRQLVDAIKAQPARSKLIPFKSNNVELDDLAICTHPEEHLSEIILAQPLMERLNQILLEYRQRAKLQAHGLLPRRKALLAGPPGTGKTMTAHVLAGELHLPLYTVLMDKLVTKYMGETSAKLRQIFTCMSQQLGVYLFDEFDAIGGDRVRDNDVGEMRRVLNTFLQLLEQDTSGGLIIAVTNEVSILDAALFRRFDDVLYYSNPDFPSIERLLRNKLGVFWEEPANMGELFDAADGLSHAEVTQACADAIKNAILHDTATASVNEVILALEAKKAKYAQVNG